jgi:hypothetical protein
MTYLGPAAEAAHGGHSSPMFDLFVGFIGLVITWAGYSRKTPPRGPVLWVTLGITAICGVFLYAGFAAILH